MAFNPEMLLLARELRGYTQSELAQLSGIAQYLISKYEGGLVEPGNENTERLAVTLGLPVSFFAIDDTRLRPSGLHVLYRKRYITPIHTLRKLTAETNFTRIHIMLMLDDPDFRVKRFPQYKSREGRDIEDVAKKTRAFLDIPSGPIVNLVDRLERVGGFVLEGLFDAPDVDALIVADQHAPPIIYMARDVSGDRRRFSIAHELAHYLMHDIVDDAAENEADAFAAALLMPADEIKDDFSKPLTFDRLIDLKIKWKVSIQSIVTRAKDTGAIGPEQYTTLYKRISKYGWRKKEPVDIPAEIPRHLRKMFDYYFKRKGLPASQLAARLSISTEEFVERYRPWLDTQAMRDAMAESLEVVASGSQVVCEVPQRVVERKLLLG